MKTMEKPPKQTLGLKRNTIDKYYTKPEIVRACIYHMKQHIGISPHDIVIEPSAGNGAFISAIKELPAHDHAFYDIKPEHPLVQKQDYLAFSHEHLGDITDVNRKIHVIGNPPFGRQSSLAIKFIKKSVEFCHSMSFILPKSFKKDSMKKHIPLDYHLLLEEDIPKNGFTVDGKDHDVPCVFQIWEKKTTQRKIPKKLVPHQFRFVKKHEHPDISFRRVGVNAGDISYDPDDKSEQSHYFICFDGELTPALYQQLCQLEYSGKNYTVGPRSISKQELIRAFHSVMLK